MPDWLATFGEAIDRRDLVQIAVLAVAIYAGLSLLGRAHGTGLVRGLGLLTVGVFLLAQLLIVSFDLHELRLVLDYLLTTAVLGLIVIFQPELRRGLAALGSYGGFHLSCRAAEPLAERLADAAVALSRDRVGALIAVERRIALDPVIASGEPIDGLASAVLLRSIFTPPGPLHDGAVIVRDGKIAAAGCQLPLAQPSPDGPRVGMRHRAALGLSEECDAVVLVVSEETGRISLAVDGKLETIGRDLVGEKLMTLTRRAA